MSILILGICFGHIAGIKFCGSPICTTARICCNNFGPKLSDFNTPPPQRKRKNVLFALLFLIFNGLLLWNCWSTETIHNIALNILIGMTSMLRAEFVNTSMCNIRLEVTHSAAT